MRMIAESMDVPFEHVRSEMLSKPEIRAELRNHGINPDDV
jgi:hypothetical protein